MNLKKFMQYIGLYYLPISCASDGLIAWLTLMTRARSVNILQLGVRTSMVLHLVISYATAIKSGIMLHAVYKTYFGHMQYYALCKPHP